MKALQLPSDKLAISLSVLCGIHCLALPVMIGLFPSIATMFFAEEAFHVWMVVAVLPISFLALSMGFKKHSQHSAWKLAAIGAFFLVAAIVLHHEIGHLGETVFTLTGVSLIALGHYKNIHACKKQDNCPCKGEKAA